MLILSLDEIVSSGNENNLSIYLNKSEDSLLKKIRLYIMTLDTTS
jgi:hypothetical protein